MTSTLDANSDSYEQLREDAGRLGETGDAPMLPLARAVRRRTTTAMGPAHRNRPGRRAALILTVLGVLSTVTGGARAHIGPAAVRAVLAMEEGEPTILLLNEGLALRQDGGFHYVCPAIWGDSEMRDTVVVNGEILIGADSGLWIFGPDGSARPHPEAAAAGGVPLITGASAEHLMQLRLDGDVTQILRADAEQVAIVWSSIARWDTMGVASDFVVLLAMNTGQIQLLRLATDGSELGQESAMGPETGLGPVARFIGERPYITLKRLLDDGSWGVEVGLLEEGAWESLAIAVTFVGPSLGPDGELLVSIDGQLSTFDDHELQALPLETPVNCIDDFEGFIYVCDSVGLREMTTDGPGEPLFELLELQPPLEALVPEDKRVMCQQQWELYQQDLAWVGSTLPGADGGVAYPGDAGANAADAGVTGEDPPVGMDAGAAGREAGGEEMNGDSGDDGGCRVAGRGGVGSWAPLGWIALALVAVRRRRSPAV